MDEQDKKLVSRARDIAFKESYDGMAEVYALIEKAHSPEARKVIKGIYVELYHREEASVGLL